MKRKAPHYPGHPLGEGGGEFQMTGALIHFSNSCKNDKRNSNLFFNNKQCKNETQIRFSKWCENENRKMKFKSVFQSEAKTKKEIRSSNPFFKVKRKRKTKSKIQICFSMSCENEKCKWHLNLFIFPCHRKTVGTKGTRILWTENSNEHPKTREQQNHDIEIPQNRLVSSGSRLMKVQIGWIFSISEIYRDYGTAGHLTSVKILTITASVLHSLN